MDLLDSEMPQTISVEGRVMKELLFDMFCGLFQAEGCRCDTDIPPTLPDVCIAYKLHLECGRLINLYDWLQVSCSLIAL